MPNSFTTTSTTGYGNRMVDSIKGVLFGFILFIASFGLLFWNEGRVDLSTIAKTASDIRSTSASANASLNGSLVSTTGVVNSSETLSDDLFLKPAAYMTIERHVEMYVWQEKESKHTTNNTGGSSTTETTYTYSKVWQENPASSDNFAHSDGHQNPQKSVENYTQKVRAATIGVYRFDPQSATLPNAYPLVLDTHNVTMKNGATLVNSNYIFIRKSTDGTIDNPGVGDLRVSYRVLTPGFSGTIFGKLNGGSIDPFVNQQGTTLYRVFVGIRDQAIATLHSEYTMWLWIYRLGGFLLMWLGLSMLLGPVNIVLDFLPIAGALSRGLIGIVTFIVAFVLSFVTIFVSMLIHNVVALVVALVVAIAAMIVLGKMVKKKVSG